MGEFGHHPFVDPSRPHSYDAVPPVVHVNPNDYAQEYEWYGANEALRIQQDRQNWDYSQYDGTTESVHDLPLPATLQERVGDAVGGLIELVADLQRTSDLGTWARASELYSALHSLSIDDLQTHPNLLINVCMWWPSSLPIEVMERAGLADDMEVYGQWYNLIDKIDATRAHYEQITDWLIRNRMMQRATQQTVQAYLQD